MKKRYDETNNEIAFEDVSMAASLMSDYFNEQGEKRKGLEFVRVQDTPFPETKEIVLKKSNDFAEIIQLYLNKRMRVEPHEYLNRIGELKDLIKSRIKQTNSHNTHITEEHDE